MGRGVDAAREAGDHHQRARELGGQALGHALTIGRGVAATHQGDRAARQQRCIAQDNESGGCIVQHGQQRRVIRFSGENDACAQPVEGVQFALSVVRRGDSRRRGTSAGARQHR